MTRRVRDWVPAAVAVLLCGSGGTVSVSYAAPPVVAHWKVERATGKPLAPGAVFVLNLTARIEPGWHLYALEEPEGGPIATEIGLAEGDPLALLGVSGPKPRQVLDPVLHAMTGVFEKSAAFTLRVRAPQGTIPTGAVSHVLVRYQSCNAQVCLPPRTDTVELPLHGVVP